MKSQIGEREMVSECVLACVCVCVPADSFCIKSLGRELHPKLQLRESQREKRDSETVRQRGWEWESVWGTMWLFNIYSSEWVIFKKLLFLSLYATQRESERVWFLNNCSSLRYMQDREWEGGGCHCWCHSSDTMVGNLEDTMVDAIVDFVVDAMVNAMVDALGDAMVDTWHP